MKRRKLGFWILALTMGTACGRFYAGEVEEENCWKEGCPPGMVCTAGEGGEGHCRAVPLEAEGACHVGDDSCGLGQICIGHDGDNRQGAPGECHAECFLGEEGCSFDKVCIGAPLAKAGDPGRCLYSESPQCRIGDGSCNAGHVCTGLLGAPFNAPGWCRKERLGTPCASDPECMRGAVCEGGSCIAGERSGEAVVAALKHFQLVQGEKVLSPWEVDGEQNPHPGFVNQSAPTTAHVVLQGPGANKGLELEDATCTLESACEGDVCAWQCVLLSDWAGTGENARWEELHLALGGAEGEREHTWRYLITPPPVVSLEMESEVEGRVLLGSTLRLCATAPNYSVLTHNFQSQLTSMAVERTERAGQEVQLAWKPASRVSPSKMCQEAWLPLSGVSGEFLQITVRVDVADTVGNPLGTVRPSLERAPLTTRIECSPPNVTYGATTQPLAMSDRRLLFAGSNNNLHMFDTATCSLSGSLETSTVQGPMVVLGDTARVALATGAGVTSRAHRLLLVDVSTGAPRDDSTRDCARNSNNIQNNATFDQGLSLLSFPNNATGTPWRLAAPANSSTNSQTRLVAYAPMEEAVAGRCVTSAVVPRSFQTTTVQKASGAVTGVYNSATAGSIVVQEWHFDASTLAWRTEPPPPQTLSNPSPMAVFGNDSIWIRRTSFGSPAVIDSQGRAYVVALATPATSYELRRYAANANEADPHEASMQLPSGLFAVVGSPLLGEPASGHVAEIYVVATSGQVSAFDAETLSLLWTEESLSIPINPGAQPVLVANADGSGTLWVVGTAGQVRGIRVNSPGLNRAAPWPKAFRDNCNTSSRLSTPHTFPSCF